MDIRNFRRYTKSQIHNARIQWISGLTLLCGGEFFSASDYSPRSSRVVTPKNYASAGGASALENHTKNGFSGMWVGNYEGIFYQKKKDFMSAAKEISVGIQN